MLVGVLLWLFVGVVYGHEDLITPYSNVVCHGIYSNGQVSVRLSGSLEDSTFSVLVMNSLDDSHFSILEGSDRVNLCSQPNVDRGECEPSQLDTFLVSKGNTSFPILNVALKGEATKNPVSYKVGPSGYYCVVVYAHKQGAISIGDFRAAVTIENTFGQIPAIEYPKLVFYGVLSLIYFVIACYWAYLARKNFDSLLKMQHIISGVVGFVFVEHLFMYWYYSNYNRNGSPSTFLLFLISVLNSGRNAISFFMLLIVSLGYGVWKPSLGSTMKKCIALAVAHFVFNLLYVSGSLLTISPTSSNILIFVLPLSTTMTIFYYWTLHALETTMKALATNRQNVKLRMYRNLQYILFASVIVLMVFFMVNSVFFAKRNDPDWLPTHWMYKWILMDGWLNILYLFVFCAILWLWRPTDNNERYGLTEIQSDDYEDGVDLQEFDENGLPVNNANKETLWEEEDDVMDWAEQKFGFEEDENRQSSTRK